MSFVDSIFRLGRLVGSGGFSNVFEAHETSTGKIVALKKSRVSLKVQRTIMYYEARILRLLAGHPSIPAVFAYGRFEHFEYLAMPMLGRSLDDMMDKYGKQPLSIVLRVADQMLSAFEHIHGRRIVHRDIKPGNIMMPADENDVSVLYVIDFGLARPCLRGDPSICNLFDERRNLVGTLMWASLNAHHGIDLAPRDDLESLAYTLLFLLRGELPWKTLCQRGTLLGRLAQIREKKRAWPGSRLAEGHPPLFGELLDYARGLKFHEPIDYGHFRARFQAIHVASSDMVESESGDQAKPSKIVEAYECPVEVGQLVCVQIVSHISIEGYSMQAGDRSHWHDPGLFYDEWTTAPRPAVVINTTSDRLSPLPKIQVVPVGHGTPAKDTDFIPFSVSSSRAALSETIVTEPPWEMPDTYCYAFPQAAWFYCLPTQESAPAHWGINRENIELLREKFAPSLPWSHWVEREHDPDPDVRHSSRIARQSVKFFVKVMGLQPSNINSTGSEDPIDWEGDRAWFDECVKIARRRGWEDGWDWTASGEKAFRGDKISHMSDSYYGSDHSLWEKPQEERDRTLSLESYQWDINPVAGVMDDIENILQVI